MQPLLSIVVLVYNTAEYLPACFDSLLSQNYRNVEIIAIDDSSTDDSLAICRDYEQRYPNFRCLTQANGGGAVVGNLGISLARGDYVALVDSDDVVTEEGYSLLIAEAMASNADIVIGRATRLIEGQLSAAGFLYEPLVWSQHRRVSSVDEFPELLHDGFYWNKIFRLAFLREYGLGMVPGLLYADREFVHKAYFYSRKTSIITALVYKWRTRPVGAGASITQSTTQISNFLDRIRSVEIEWHDFDGIPAAETYRRLIAVTNLQRALQVINAIIPSPEFRRVFITAIQRLLSLFGDIDYRALGVRRVLYLELIKRDEVAGLCYLLALPFHGDVLAIDGHGYWQQPFLDNLELGLSPESSRIDFPTIGFFRVGGWSLNSSHLALELEIHDTIMAHCEVDFALQALDGGADIPFQSLGLKGAGRYLFSVQLDSTRNDSLYGLALRYRSSVGNGQYRLGGALLTDSGAAVLPMSADNGYQLLYSAPMGGVSLRTP